MESTDKEADLKRYYRKINGNVINMTPGAVAVAA